MRLEEALRIYAQTSTSMELHADVQLLCAGFKKNVQALLSKGFSFRWHYDAKKMAQYVEKLSSAVTELQDKVDELGAREGERKTGERRREQSGQ
jgi:hypothetical protein